MSLPYHGHPGSRPLPGLPDTRVAPPPPLGGLELPRPLGAVPADDLTVAQRGVHPDVVDVATVLALVGDLEPPPEPVSRDAAAFAFSFSRADLTERAFPSTRSAADAECVGGRSGSEVKGAAAKRNRHLVHDFFSALDLGRPSSKLRSSCSGSGRGASPGHSPRRREHQREPAGARGVSATVTGRRRGPAKTARASAEPAGARGVTHPRRSADRDHFGSESPCLA